MKRVTATYEYSWRVSLRFYRIVLDYTLQGTWWRSPRWWVLATARSGAAWTVTALGAEDSHKGVHTALMDINNILQAFGPTVAVMFVLWKGIWPFVLKQIEHAQGENRRITDGFIAALEKMQEGQGAMVRSIDRMGDGMRDLGERVEGLKTFIDKEKK